MPLPEGIRIALVVICGGILAVTIVIGALWLLAARHRPPSDWPESSGHESPGYRQGGGDCE